MEDILFSVIIPVYNRESLVGDAIESVLNQTYSNWEAILINDGSTDNSLEVLRKYEKTDSRIKVIDKENGGVSSARNCGLDVAKGDYIVFCDSDDLLSQDELVTLNKYVNEYGRIDIFCFGTKYENGGQSLTIGYEFNKLFDKNYIVNEIIPSILHIKNSDRDIFPSCPLKAYSRECIEKNNLRFDKSLKSWEDNFFNICFLKYANNILFMDKALYVIRLLATNHLSHEYSIQTIKDLSYKFNILKNFFDKQYDFYNIDMATWYFNVINDYILELIKRKSISQTDLNNLFVDKNIINWFKLALKKNRVEKKISNCVENSNVNKIMGTYLKLARIKKKQFFLKRIKIKLNKIFKK